MRESMLSTLPSNVRAASAADVAVMPRPVRSAPTLTSGPKNPP